MHSSAFLAAALPHLYLSAYALFNLAVAAAWWALAGYFLRKSRSIAPDTATSAEIRKVCWKAALAAFLFGISDCLEISPIGLSAFTLTVKFGSGLSLFACLMRYDYLKRGPIALAPWRFIAAGVILVLAIYLCTR
ncbi:MAG: hypothetical protein ACAI35_27875 [Candidatus Methylacidiphilales bacterium]|nr:hypothetical protein [Candidatus Methylacidiphilales bacterium]